MKVHLDQATHNQEFHDCIQKNFIAKFFDWKITVLFYVALHGLKALADKRGINIGQTHQDIERNSNPDRDNAKMRITRNAWKEYKNLYNYSHTARYEGVTDISTFEKLKELDHSFCVTHLSNFKAYLKGQGVSI